MLHVVDVEAMGPALGEVVDEGAAWRAVIGRLGAVGEVDLEDGEVAAGPDAGDLGPDPEHDCLAFVGGPGAMPSHRPAVSRTWTPAV